MFPEPGYCCKAGLNISHGQNWLGMSRTSMPLSLRCRGYREKLSSRVDEEGVQLVNAACAAIMPGLDSSQWWVGVVTATDNHTNEV